MKDVLVRRNIFPLFIFCLLSITGFAESQENNVLPPCSQRSAILQTPILDYARWCLEEVLAEQGDETLALTKLETGPDGTLYGTRPRMGQIVAIRDTDDNALPDVIEILADGLTLPNGLAYYQDNLYVVGGPRIYRIAPATGDVTLLVNDLPYDGRGFWTGGLAIGADDRIYVGIGASCDYCEPENPERGTILSFDLEGGNRQVVARGLRHPADLVFYKGQLYVVDTARDDLVDIGDSRIGDTAALDELNRVESGAHFGWPYCVGGDNRPDLPTDHFDCSSATAPVVRFPTHSAPTGLTVYTHSSLQGLSGALVVTLGGLPDPRGVVGYELMAVHFDDAQFPFATETLIPYSRQASNFLRFAVQYYDARVGYIGADNLSDLSYNGLSLWPYHPYDTAVSPEGWLYLSVGGGRILVMRPAR